MDFHFITPKKFVLERASKTIKPGKHTTSQHKQAENGS